MKSFLTIMLLLVSVTFCAAQPAVSPYAGQQTRAIKTLSADEVSSYLSGHGMGLARPAELNGYPGPRHVLDAAAELKLTPEQTVTLTQAFDVMHAAAVPLGETVVARETELDRLFAQHQITEDSLAALTLEIGRLQGELRAVHLKAHLATIRILSPEQVAAYNHLRGYDDAKPATAMPEAHQHNSP